MNDVLKFLKSYLDDFLSIFKLVTKGKFYFNIGLILIIVVVISQSPVIIKLTPLLIKVLLFGGLGLMLLGNIIQKWNSGDWKK